MHQQFSEQETVLPVELPLWSALTTKEQMRRFELLRLAFFVLKLRKLEQRQREVLHTQKEGQAMRDSEHEFRCNLLRHAIFQQMITLSALGAHSQAMELINVCRA